MAPPFFGAAAPGRWFRGLAAVPTVAAPTARCLPSRPPGRWGSTRTQRRREQRRRARSSVARCSPVSKLLESAPALKTDVRFPDVVSERRASPLLAGTAFFEEDVRVAQQHHLASSDATGTNALAPLIEALEARLVGLENRLALTTPCFAAVATLPDLEARASFEGSACGSM